MKLEDIKVGMEVKKPTRKTKGWGLEQWEREEVSNAKPPYKVTAILRPTIEVNGLGVFNPEDLDPIEEPIKLRFKVGDKVKVIANTNHHEFEIGEEIIIEEVNSIPVDHYKSRGLTGIKDFWYMNDEDLEPIKEEIVHKYKVGDKVKIVARNHNHNYDMGEIVEITNLCAKDFKDKISYRAKGKNGNYFCLEQDFAPIPEPLKVGDRIKKPKTKKGDPNWEKEYSSDYRTDEYYYTGMYDGDAIVCQRVSPGSGNYFHLEELEKWDEMQELPRIQYLQPPIDSNDFIIIDSLNSLNSQIPKMKQTPKVGEIWGIHDIEFEIMEVPNFYSKEYTVKVLATGNVFQPIIGAEKGWTKVKDAPSMPQTGEPQIGEIWETTASQAEIFAIIPGSFKPYILQYPTGARFSSTRENLKRKLKNSSNSITNKQTTMKPLYVESPMTGIVPAFTDHLTKTLKLKFPYDGGDARSSGFSFFTNEGQTVSACNQFTLPEQWNEAVEYAKKFAEYCTPKKPEYVRFESSVGVVLIYWDHIIYSGTSVTINEVKIIKKSLYSDRKVGGHGLKVTRFKIGCTEFTIEDLDAVLKAYKENFE